MKIREGFVSNSSSSNFVVAIRKPTTPMEKLLIETVTILATEKCKGEFDDCEIGIYKDGLNDEITRIDEDITCGNNRIAKLEKLSKVKNIKEILQLAKEADKTLRYTKHNEESAFKFNLDDEIDSIKSRIKVLNNQKQSIQDRLTKLGELNNTERVLIFSKDQWDYDRVKRALTLFEEVGKILKVIDADTN